MANVLERYILRRRNRSSNSSEDSNNSPDKKKPKNQDQDFVAEDEGDDIWKALTMTENVNRQLEQILEKLDNIEGALKNIYTKLDNLESRTKQLEEAQQGSEHDISIVKETLSKKGNDLENMNAKGEVSEVELANLARQVKDLEKKTDELHTKNLYLEAYSRRENIKFMNVQEFTTGDRREDTEQVLRDFLEQELGFGDARSVEIQRVHRVGKSKDGKPRPIVARFLRYQDCEKILALGRLLQGTGYQMFRDLPNEIIDRRKPQVATLKEARKNGIPAAFSASQPDKLFVRGKFWPVGKPLVIQGRE